MLYIAAIDGMQGRHRSAARLLGYVDTWAARGYRWDPAEAACRDQLLERLTQTLDAQTLAGDLAIGAKLNEETAAEQALRT
jgi:hypothetical protein